MNTFGEPNVVLKAIGRKRKPLKYLVTSELKMAGRDIVLWYSKRWLIETWHREMKQNFGFIDCHSSRFTAVESHVNFALTAFLLQKESGKSQMRIEEYMHQKALIKINHELNRFGSKLRLKSLVSAEFKVSAFRIALLRSWRILL